MRTFPAVVVTGPRQSGKTTLLQYGWGSSHRFVTLEDPDVRMRAQEDPRGFLDFHSPPVILDEIQYVPELLSYIKTMIDEDRRPGRWLFTGSQNFPLMHGISQSLAGRAAVLCLLPFSLSEIAGRGLQSLDPAKLLKAKADTFPTHKAKTSLADWILRGGYPELCRDRKVDRQLWCSSYIATYLERDIRQLINVTELRAFELFLRACAARTGQILKLSELARDIGVSVPTTRRWLSALETSRQVYLLMPYYKSLGKRLVKSPKIYFLDTALCTYLMGIHDSEVLLNGQSFGALFETAIVADWVKRYLHGGYQPPLYYLRTRDGLEVDLLIEECQKLNLLEIKASMTLTPKHSQPLKLWRKQLGARVGLTALIGRVKKIEPLSRGIMALPWNTYLSS
ncbi:MAG: ATP-binding protein [Candidatus Tritonobacter lacicola]|nr:ATP-binding protein [Candidatus Tritonobacter lacicola]